MAGAYGRVLRDVQAKEIAFNKAIEKVRSVIEGKGEMAGAREVLESIDDLVARAQAALRAV